MKKMIFYTVALLISAVIVLALPVSGEEKIYEDVIRLHVLAASDSEEDQALKLAVRDEILRRYSADLDTAEGIEAADRKIASLCGEIEKTAREVVESRGYAYSVKVEYGEEEYPTREYGAYTFPAGSYRSLRIVIGEGSGANWWCVLFPPLCLDVATGTAPEDDALSVGLSPEEHEIITGTGDGGYRVKFKALELLEGVFRNRER